MNLKQMLDIISNGSADAVESQWLAGIESNPSPDVITDILQAVVKADMMDTAESMAWALVEFNRDRLDDSQLLQYAKAASHGVPASDQLREEAAKLLRKIHGGKELFEEVLKTSGLLTGQSPRRAFRTFETCIDLKKGDYLVNRYDFNVLCVVEYSNVMGEFTLTDSSGGTERFIPRELADEFDPADDDDFRILAIHQPEVLEKMIAREPAAALVSICKAHGGEIDANQIKEQLVPKFLTAKKWSPWWSRARTAAKKSDTLSLSTDRPVVVSYHPGGRSLEEELSDQVQASQTPNEKLEILRTYARELKTRNSQPDNEFLTAIATDLAEMAEQWSVKRPVDALCAALALENLPKLGFDGVELTFPSASDILVLAKKPAWCISHLEDHSQWAAAFKALAAREDADTHYAALLKLTPANLLNDLASHVSGEQISELAAAAMLEPRKLLQVCLWLWKGTKKKFDNMPNAVEIFRRFMNVLSDVDQDLEISQDLRRDIRQSIRAAINASNYKRFRKAMAEVDDAVAATVLNLVRRAEGLGDAAEQELPNIIREHHYSLFIEKKIVPWEDKNSIYTTRAALNTREDELKYLVDVKMLENAKAIGAAAEHGDLSENSEWKFAIEERDLLRAQAAKMQDELTKAKLIDFGTCDNQNVVIGSRVTLKSVADEHEIILTLLGPWESDLEKRIFNYLTPLGQELLGKKVGDKVELKFEGEPISYEIIKTEAGQ